MKAAAAASQEQEEADAGRAQLCAKTAKPVSCCQRSRELSDPPVDFPHPMRPCGLTPGHNWHPRNDGQPGNPGSSMYSLPGWDLNWNRCTHCEPDLNYTTALPNCPDTLMQYKKPAPVSHSDGFSHVHKPLSHYVGTDEPSHRAWK